MKMLLALSILLTSCTHAPVKIPKGGGLYPFGAYKHSVRINILKPETRSMEMRGVVSIQPDKLIVVGLSSIGTTVFRIEEDLKTGEVKKAFYLELMAKNEDRFMEFYRLIRELLTAPKGSTQFDRGEAHFEVSAPDSNGIFRKIHIAHPQVNIDIEVTGYEF